MPQPTYRRRLLRLAFLSFLAWVLAALGRGRSRPVGALSTASPAPDARARADVPGWASSPAPVRRRARAARPRRLAASLAFATLFFAGASLSAFGGDQVVALLEEDAGSETLVLAEEAPPAEEPVTVPKGRLAEEPAEPEPAPPLEPAPTPEPAPAPELEAAPAPEPEAAPAADAGAAPVEAAPAEPAVESDVPADDPPAATGEQLAAWLTRPAPAPAPAPKARRATGRPAPAPAPAAPPALDPEVDDARLAATIWLNRTLPETTPASLRLSRELARKLGSAARGAGVDWAFLLGVLRADGSRGQVPARPATLAESARRLAVHRSRGDRWDAALAFTGRTAAADRAVALARYYRAVGLETLVQGLTFRQEALGKKVLADERVTLYAGGRADVEAGRIDVRVLALIAYLAESHGQVTVSSLFSGHRVYARPGVVSAHTYGQAVDIAALGGVSIVGHQQPGGVTERAVRDILLLPAEMRPRQVISLLGLGGPSFPLADHGDHIHVGY